ncbi:hypothetical protein HMPREF9554_02123 [Treponema phagedenis F0421]|nr:hypothetical protein HMPREF9554_02123 [Treponema phagedenis F0421]
MTTEFFMFYNNYPINTSTYTSPKFFKGSDEAVLLIHGYTGSPREMTWLGEQIHKAGYTVYIPRLPGHGTCKEDFLSSSWKDWLRCVCDAYINLAAEYKKVFVGGLSMGGVLTALIAAKFNPEKIFLCAPAFIAADARLKLTPFLKFFIKEVKTEVGFFYPEPDYQEAVKDYTGAEYVPTAADLYKLQKLAIKQLPSIRSKTLTVISHGDVTVPFSVKEVIDAHLQAPNEYLILEKSCHIVVDDVEREQVAEGIIRFLNS